MCCGLSFVRHIQIEAAFVREKNLNSLQSFRGDTCETKDAGPKKKQSQSMRICFTGVNERRFLTDANGQ